MLKLLIAILLSMLLFADELDFQKHTPTGAAIVQNGLQKFIAAYQEESFDPGHTPQLRCGHLFRIILVPMSTEYLNVGEQERRETVKRRALPNGHSLITFGEWRIEMLSNSAADREALKLGGETVISAAHVLIAVRRDTILITVTGHW